jgi:hypothetical protein
MDLNPETESDVIAGGGAIGFLFGKPFGFDIWRRALFAADSLSDYGSSGPRLVASQGSFVQ